MSKQARQLIEEELEKYEQDQGIFVNESALSFDFIPEVLLHRNTQILELTRIFKGIFAKNPIDEPFRQTAILVGSLGSGKTSTARRFGADLEKLAERKISGVRVVFRHYNCRVNRTINVLFGEILKGFLPYFPSRGFSANELVNELLSVLEKKNYYLFLALDEIDYLFGDDQLNTLLYTLSRSQEVEIESMSARLSLLLITKSRDFVFLLDPSTKSSIAKNIISFPPYTAAQLFDILKKRTELGLVHDSAPESIIHIISEIAASHGGDARMAIELLWRCAKVAESEASKIIKPDHVRLATTSVAPIEKGVLLSLSIYCQLTLLSIARLFANYPDRFSLELSQIKAAYANECVRFGKQIVEHNLNIWPYLQHLRDRGLVSVQQERGPDEVVISTISTEMPIEDLTIELERILERRIQKTHRSNE